jgi:hypothetical protein
MKKICINITHSPYNLDKQTIKINIVDSNSNFEYHFTEFKAVNFIKCFNEFCDIECQDLSQSHRLSIIEKICDTVHSNVEDKNEIQAQCERVYTALMSEGFSAKEICDATQDIEDGELKKGISDELFILKIKEHMSKPKKETVKN